MSKRKYNIGLLNDEDDGDDEQFSGLNIFKKTKASAQEPKEEDSTIHTSATT